MTKSVGEIEHNIPIPEYRRGRIASIAKQMKVGDSVLISVFDIGALRTNLWRCGLKMHHGSALEDKKNQLIRCWVVGKRSNYLWQTEIKNDSKISHVKNEHKSNVPTVKQQNVGVRAAQP